MIRCIISLAVLCMPAVALAQAPEDPFRWLEEIDGEAAVAWVEEQNLQSTEELEAAPVFQPVYDRVLEILDSEDRIPSPGLRGDAVYNFWKDASHPRGIWRRSALKAYNGGEPEWEILLDVDALAEADGVPWVFKGARCLPPEGRRCLLTLSRGGADAAEVREFDTADKGFVADGFFLPEAKSSVAWLDEDTLWVGTDFGEGSLTAAGYPRLVKLWHRGTPLAEAKTVFAGEPGDVACHGTSVHTPDGRYDLVVRVPEFYRSELYLRLGDRLVRLQVPADANLEGFFDDQLLVSLRTEWAVDGATYPGGSLLAIGLDDFLRGSRRFEVLFEPTARVVLGSVATTSGRVVLTTLDNVRSRMYSLTLGDGGWTRSPIELPGLGTALIQSTADEADRFYFSYQDFLTPSSLFFADGADIRKVDSMPAFFDASGMRVEQHEATSKDGTSVPYFLIVPAGFEANGTTPTVLHGYGGFEVSQVPVYMAVTGAAWLERGGAYAVANIRGGGEFGPAWHAAARKEKRIKSFEDFIAVAEDLLRRKVTSPDHLGIVGGSQGGLLVGGAMAMRPDLFGAVVAQVPLADMRRYHELLAGSSWMAEYGDPDILEEWAYIQTWSPYHLLEAEADYPTPLYWTNTRDDRVHPGHARKMVAKMRSLGHPVYYFENIEGGHGSGSVNTQKAYIEALEHAYLWKLLGSEQQK